MNGITLLYAVPIFLKVFVNFIKSRPEIKKTGAGLIIPALFCGFLLGVSPIYNFAFNQGWSALVGEFFGSAVAIENSGFLERSWSHLLNLLFLGLPVLLGFRPSWEMRWLVLPLIPFVFFFWGWAGFAFVKNLRKKSPAKDLLQVLAGILGLNVLGFIFTSFGLDPSGRYFLPMVIPLALAAGYSLEKLKIREGFKTLALLFVLVFNLLEL